MKVKLLLLAITIIGGVAADVSEVVLDNNNDINNAYLPPAQPNNQYLPPKVNNQYLPPRAEPNNAKPVEPQEEVSQVEDAHAEAPHAEVPQAEETHKEEVPSVEAPVEEPAPAHELQEDGYHYKRPAKLFFRFRRDVSELVDSKQQYLPPGSDETYSAVKDSSTDAVVDDVEPAHELTSQGYGYKTQKRVVYRRNRRDVSHLPERQYLAPAADTTNLSESEEIAPPLKQLYGPPSEDNGFSHDIVDNSNGYNYNTPRHVYRRNRRDVAHLPERQYLAPAADTTNLSESEEIAPPLKQLYGPPAEENGFPQDILDNSNGYSYNSPRHVYRRNRRDVAHLPERQYLAALDNNNINTNVNTQYLPPSLTTTDEHNVPEPEAAHELLSDGYHYKTNRRVVYRHF